MKYTLNARTLIFILFILVSFINTFSNTGDLKLINKKLDKFLINTEFNGSILIAKKGKVVFKNSYGFSDVEQKKLLTPRSPFNLASVSKQFTATGIMVLYEKNKLKLDDPVAKYLPQFSYIKEITIHHLLNHTSGLPDIYRILNTEWDNSKIAGNEILLKIFSDQKPELLFIPGERMQYSNTGYIVLASIIEIISGQSFYKFMENNIFKPLQMENTYAYYRTMNKYPHKERVWGLRKENDNTVLNDLIYCDGMRGDGNIHSSIEDLFKWDRSLYTEKILKRNSLKIMFTPGVLNNGNTISYGFGWGITNQGKHVHHGGKWVGFRSFIMRYLDDQDTIIVLINCVSQKTGNIIKRIKENYMY